VGVAVLLVPTFLPYVDARVRFGLGRNAFEAFMFSAAGEHFLGAFLFPLRWWQSRFVVGADVPNGAIGWGSALLALLAVGIGLGETRNGRRPAALYLTLAFVVALVSLGPLMRMHLGFAPGIPGPYLLLSVVPGWDALRAPARASMSSFLAVAILAGLGAESLLSRAGTGRGRGAAVALLVLVVLTDCWRNPFYVWKPPISAGAKAAHDWVASHAPGVPIVELPLGNPEYEGAYMVLSSRHWNPLLNGRSGFDPDGIYLRSALFWFPRPDTLVLLHDLGVGIVIVHDDLMGRPMCAFLAGHPSPYLVQVPIDPTNCVLRLLGAPAAPPVPPDRPIPITAARLTGSGGESAAAATDGDLRTDWMQDVVPAQEAWLQIDLPEAHRVQRMRLRFGPHFGDYPREYRVDASADGVAWTPIVPTRVGEAPLLGLEHDPDDLAIDVAIPPTSTAHLRLVRPAETKETPWGLFANWLRWGVHEVELYEAVGS
jgi:hypothetical protein